MGSKPGPHRRRIRPDGRIFITLLMLAWIVTFPVCGLIAWVVALGVSRLL